MPRVLCAFLLLLYPCLASTLRLEDGSLTDLGSRVLDESAITSPDPLPQSVGLY